MIKIVCKNMKVVPKNKIVGKLIGEIGSCPHLKKSEGINIGISKNKCPVEKLCKYYEEEEKED